MNLFKMIFWENVNSNEFDGLSNFKNISYFVKKNSQPIKLELVPIVPIPMYVPT